MRSAAAAPHIFWAALFIVVPLLIVVYYAFTGEDGGFSMENIFGLTDYFDIFLLSLELACGVTATLCVEGIDEDKAVQRLGDLFEQHFDFPPMR